VFHYTDQPGFLGLLRDKTLWATDLRYLNDSREYAIGFERIVNELEKCAAGNAQLESILLAVLRDVTPARANGVSVASLSLAEDDLSQWRAYSGGSGGICLQFEPVELAARIGLTGSLFGAVRYTEPEQLQIVTDLCSQIFAGAHSVVAGTMAQQEFQTRCFLSIQLACALMKNHKFANEREWRMVVWAALAPYVTAAVRPGRSMLVPYLSVRLDTVKSPTGPTFGGKLPLSSVWVGPTPHPDLALRGTWSALNLYSESAELKLSEVPFRNW
jgi:hypothetical protein